MNDNVRSWIAALRSGEFTQANGQLQKDDSYCCLGVACVIAERISNLRIHRIKEGMIIGKNLSDDQPDVLNWLGLSQGGDIDLAQRNDEGSSFEELADHIEEVLY
jgi:hypothetical protein